jgi:hypothetical protein
MSKTFKEFAEACWDSHKQVGTKISSRTGKRVPNCVPKNEDNLEEKKVKIRKGDKELLVWDAELRTYQQMGWKLVESNIPHELYDLSELGPAAMKRRARMRARMGMLQKKYSDASKAGIHPSRVSQRHNKMTVKKR